MEWNFEQVAGPFGFTEGPVWVGDAFVVYRYAGRPRDALRSQVGCLRCVAHGYESGKWADY